MDMSIISMTKFADKYSKVYDFLYMNDGENIIGYKQYIQATEQAIEEGNGLVIAFIRFRGDCLSSDRELASYHLATLMYGIPEHDEYSFLNNMKYLNESCIDIEI